MTRRGPFPGMDPWLERFWGDVHSSLATYARDQLNERLGGGLVARMQERVYIESPLTEGRQIIPDVHVYEPGGRRKSAGRGTGGAATALAEDVSAEPDLLRLPGVEVRESYVEIRDAQTGGRVVTVIEFVSRTNKTTKVGRRKYLQKQREVLASDASLVEIDLLRIGRGVSMAAEHFVPVTRRAPYHACATRHGQPEVLEYYAFPLRQRLPSIRIPLREKEPDIRLELQALVDEAYRRGRYELTDYSQPPVPPLDAADAEWAQGLIE